jgi:hypothetical protein
MDTLYSLRFGQNARSSTPYAADNLGVGRNVLGTYSMATYSTAGTDGRFANLTFDGRRNFQRVGR